MHAAAPYPPGAPTVAVVLAGGTGARMGAPVPKQLLEVGGKPVLQHTLEAFEAAPEVDRIVVVMAAGHHRAVAPIAEAAGAGKLAGVIAGGADRSASSRAAIDWARRLLGPGEDCKLLLHDAARMLVSGRIIAEVAAALDRHDAVGVAVASSDTVIEVRAEGGREFVASVPERAALRRVQTPQGFRLSVIEAAYAAAAADPAFKATDDCSVVLRYLPHVPVAVVAGEERNLKVTEPLDLVVAEALLEQP
ncbi:IspD/TarI family cytidylyltransferase [Glycomyces tenuis]|uniref:IspD/TarI family cytidylyltransferase n=1 Tax=Glycomyces tenuis TaxID=58116 RepID=UPI000424866C|nr:IspD/TarI family cytidylyltransferase [Glycomyces tenuis]